MSRPDVSVPMSEGEARGLLDMLRVTSETSSLGLHPAFEPLYRKLRRIMGQECGDLLPWEPGVCCEAATAGNPDHGRHQGSPHVATTKDGRHVWWTDAR